MIVALPYFVLGLWFVAMYLVPFLVLLMICLISVLAFIWRSVFCVSSIQCRGLVSGMRLWYCLSYSLTVCACPIRTTMICDNIAFTLVWKFCAGDCFVALFLVPFLVL